MTTRQALITFGCILTLGLTIELGGRAIRAEPARLAEEEKAMNARSVYEVAPGVVYVACGEIGCPQALANFHERYTDEPERYRAVGPEVDSDRGTIGFYFIDIRSR